MLKQFFVDFFCRKFTHPDLICNHWMMSSQVSIFLQALKFFFASSETAIFVALLLSLLKRIFLQFPNILLLPILRSHAASY